MNVTLVNRPLSLLAGIVLAIATMSFRAPENVNATSSVVLTSTSILVSTNQVSAADHVIVTLKNSAGAVICTKYATPGQTVSFVRPSEYVSGYVIKSDYFSTSNEYIIGDDTQM